MKRLTAHPAFDIRNPNKVYALIGSFCAATTCASTPPTAAATRSLADQVIALDALNPQVAARMARAFDRWRKFDDRAPGACARAALERIRAAPRLSKDVAEIVTKALA